MNISVAGGPVPCHTLFAWRKTKVSEAESKGEYQTVRTAFATTERGMPQIRGQNVGLCERPLLTFTWSAECWS